MTVKFTKITKGRRVIRVHTVRLSVKLFSLDVSAVVFGKQALLHYPSDRCCQSRVKIWPVRDHPDVVLAKFLELGGRGLGLFRKHAFLGCDRFVKLDRSGLV